MGLIESHAANKAISISSVKGNLQSQGEKCQLEKSLSRKNLGVIIAHNRSGTDKCNPRTSKSLTSFASLDATVKSEQPLKLI